MENQRWNSSVASAPYKTFQFLIDAKQAFVLTVGWMRSESGGQ